MKITNALLVISIAIVFVLSGCAQGTNEGGTPAGVGQNQGQNSGTSNAEPEKTITYKFLRNFAAPEYPEDGGEAKQKILSAMAEAGITGFDYQVVLSSGDDYTTKLNLLATSGELPDYFDIDAKTLARFVNEGLIQPLDDYLKAAPNIVNAIPESYWDHVTFDGKIYAIPNGRGEAKFNSPSVKGLNVRQDWLDQLGLQQPQTLEEIHDVLKAFVEQDPDGNGIDDTIGLGVSNVTMFASIFGAYGIIPTFWTERDGMIKKGFVLPEMKEGLELLQSWYKEGLIDPDFPIMEEKQKNEKVINSLVGFFEGDVYYTEETSNPTATALASANPNAVIDILEAPAGPDGKRGYQEVNAVSAAPFRALSAKAQDPEKLFRFLDWMADDENGGFKLVMYGVEGVDFTYDKETNTINQITPYSELYKKGYSNPVRMIYITDRRYAKLPVRNAIEKVNLHIIENELWNTLPAENDYPDLESKLWKEYLVKIVTGVWPVEKYDEFIDKYYKQGGKTIEEQANELWKQLNP